MNGACSTHIRDERRIQNVSRKRIILKWMLKKLGMRMLTGFIWLMIVPSSGLF
jgi:hypothetical protein